MSDRHDHDCGPGHHHAHDHEDGCRCGCGCEAGHRAGEVREVVVKWGDPAGGSGTGCGCPAHCRCGGHDGRHEGDHNGDDGGHEGDHNGGHDGGHGGRPTRHPGTDDGGLGNPLTPGVLHHPPRPGHWPGPRKDMQLPFLFMRANPGDTGTRPVVGPFWESPDVYILAGVHPSVAPTVPAQLGQTALAGQDNTVYAHVWNLGLGPAREVIVEFYWCDPSLGFNPVGAHLIGSTVTWLGSRRDPDCHKVVKCPTSWLPTFVNGGHECLLVRAWDVAADPLTTPEWDASVNRHLGQRNIHVVPPGQPFGAAPLAELALAGGAPGGAGHMAAGGLAPTPLGAQPLRLSVGALYGAPATITVQRHAPATMPWLQLHSGLRGTFPAQAVGTGQLLLAHPGGADQTGPLTAHGDDAQVLFAPTDGPPPVGQAHVYRVTASQGGQVVGGYTVVHLG